MLYGHTPCIEPLITTYGYLYQAVSLELDDLSRIDVAAPLVLSQSQHACGQVALLEPHLLKQRSRKLRPSLESWDGITGGSFVDAMWNRAATCKRMRLCTMFFCNSPLCYKWQGRLVDLAGQAVILRSSAKGVTSVSGAASSSISSQPTVS